MLIKAALKGYRRMEEDILKSMLEHYNFLIAMTALTSLAILLKCICAIKYQILIKETEQMASSKNQILRSMITKYESCFKLHLPVKNTESFVYVHLDNFRFLGIPLKNLENFDLCCGFFVFFSALLNIMGGIYYALPTKWILVQVMTCSIFLVFLGLSEFLFQTRKKGALFTLHLIHYFDNTLSAKLFREYMEPDKRSTYLQEYFRNPAKNTAAAETPAATLEKELAPDMQELIDSLLEEKKVTEQINEKKEQLAHAASLEKYHLVEEIMKEYL